jgi:hypothetical protein
MIQIRYRQARMGMKEDLGFGWGLETALVWFFLMVSHTYV